MDMSNHAHLNTYNYLVGEEEDNIRIDNFLTNSIKKEDAEINFTRQDVIRAIRSGHATVDGKTQLKPSKKIHSGERVVLRVKPEQKESLYPQKYLPLNKVFEDKNIVAINKPAGIPTHPSLHYTKGTVANWFLGNYPSMANVGEDPMRPGIVHRLDKDTSGVLVLAKTKRAYAELKKQFHDRKVNKTYIALVWGVLTESELHIDKPIARAKNFRRQTIAAHSHYKGTPRSAVTDVRVLAQYNTYALIEAKPKTGRMHQIRVHLASIGHPIVGDSLYAHRNYATPSYVKRHLLHASEITFDLLTQQYDIHASLPEDIKITLK